MYEYPFGNGQQLNLDWFLAEWKNLLAAWEAEKNGIEGALQAEIDRAEAALADVFAARDAAAQSAANALESKNAAAQSASDASGYLATVQADANTARDAAQNAAQSESNAAESAQTALASKNTAANSERNAAQSEQNALASKNAAAQSASDADASKSAAAQSAADADASKSAAAQSAEDASGAAESVEASAEQITNNTSDINVLKESIANNFPTDITPVAKALSGAYSSLISRNYGQFTLEPSVGNIASIDIYQPFNLKPGLYKLVIDVEDNSVTSESTARFGYISIRSGSLVEPTLDVFPNLITENRKYEFPFRVNTEAEYRVVVSILRRDTTGTITARAFVDYALPSTALGLALSN